MCCKKIENIMQNFYSIGYSKVQNEFGTIFHLKIKDNKIIWGISELNQALFNSGNLIHKTDFKKRTIDLLANKFPYFNKLELSSKEYVILDMEYNIKNLHLLLSIFKFIEGQDEDRFNQLQDQKQKSQDKLKSICDFAKSQNIKLSKNTLKELEADIGIINCPSYELYTTASCAVKKEIANFKPNIPTENKKEVFISEKINERIEFLNSFDHYVKVEYWQEVDIEEIIALFQFDYKKYTFITKKIQEEIIEQLKTFEKDEQRKKWSGDRDIFKNIREKLVSI